MLIGLAALLLGCSESPTRPVLEADVPEAAPLDLAVRSSLRAAVVSAHRQYDPAERMLKVAFSNPGYHTSLSGGFVHPTRTSLHYAAALLELEDEPLRRRAADILQRVVRLQDKDPSSRTYGLWSWYLEEPLSQMRPPDWNQADFNGTTLLQVALHHRERVPRDLLAQVDSAILRAARSIQRRNVGPEYTNVAIAGTYVTLVAAETYDLPDLKAYALSRLRRFHAFTMKHGAFSEYNSPSYTLVALQELGRLRQHARDPEARRLVDELYRSPPNESSPPGRGGREDHRPCAAALHPRAVHPQAARTSATPTRRSLSERGIRHRRGRQEIHQPRGSAR